MTHAPATPGDTRANALVPASWNERLHDGSTVQVRPLTRQDAGLEQDFLERCSPQARRFRFLGQIRPSREQAERLTHLDALHDVAFVAIASERDGEHAVGVSRYSTGTGDADAECAVMVRDDWQGRGLGSVLMRHLIEVARVRNVRTLTSVDAADNQAMQELASFLGFRRNVDPGDPTRVIHTLTL